MQDKLKTILNIVLFGLIAIIVIEIVNLKTEVHRQQEEITALANALIDISRLHE